MRRRNELMPADGDESNVDEAASVATVSTVEQNSDTRSAAGICIASSAYVFVLLLMVTAAAVVLEVQHNWTSSVVKMWADLKGGGGGNGASSAPEKAGDISLGGLLPSIKDDGSCLSRFQSTFYRKVSKHNPSPYLQERLRKYEALHKICAPNTELYDKFVHQLKVNGSTEAIECKYIVSVPYSGLGNRILSIASTFMYALLTNRVLLVKKGPEMIDVFCEPFPEGTWVLPENFRFIDESKDYYKHSPRAYGNMLRNKVIDDKVNATWTGGGPLHVPVVIYAGHDSGVEDQRFFKERDQQFLEKFPLMVMSSNLYFIPSLFTVPKFADEMGRLFPERDVVFHHLGRYLFHPTNSVWGLITRYYREYLAKADQRTGIQIRILDGSPVQIVSDQILSCLSTNEILPSVDPQRQVTSRARGKLRAVLLTYLGSQFLKRMRAMYGKHPTTNGDIIGVYQPSHEERQHTESRSHNMKAWAEMYLLSLTDVLVTSAGSTFGYVAQGLGGLEPWILLRRADQKVPEPPCRKLNSSEPCNLSAANIYRARRCAHIRMCEDSGGGTKLTSVP